MNEQDFAVLLDLKARLEALEARYPMNQRIKKLHADGWRAFCKLRGALGVTDEQFAIIAMPQGGGTPKTDQPEGGE